MHAAPTCIYVGLMHKAPRLLHRVLLLHSNPVQSEESAFDVTGLVNSPGPVTFHLYTWRNGVLTKIHLLSVIRTRNIRSWFFFVC